MNWVKFLECLDDKDRVDLYFELQVHFADQNREPNEQELACIQAGDAIGFILAYRRRVGCGLKEAKDLFDARRK